MLDQLYTLNPWLAYGLSTAIVLAAAEFGHLIGKLWRRRHGEAAESPLLTLEGAALGLLALMIGFSFSMALSRLDARLIAVVNEANAIGTTALRARMLPEPQASEVKKLLRNYVQLRIDLTRTAQGQTSLDQAISRSNAIQAEVWQHAMAVSAAAPRSIPTGLFVQSLNQMIDLQEKRLAAMRNRVPAAVFLLLYAIAAVAIGFSGYVSGLGGRGGRVPVMIMGVLVASVIGMIGDLDRSQSGFITVGQQSMHNLAESLNR
jgi:hypothetical protein